MAIRTILSEAKRRILSRERPSKRRTNVLLTRPTYFNRHGGRDFMILGTGPSIGQYGERIKDFICERDLIVIGVNAITEFLTPDYHLFTNRERFRQFGKTVDPSRSQALLSVYFTDQMIQECCAAPYELVMWRDPGDPEQCDIDGEGVITQRGTSGTLMLAVAYVMGAREIFVAGIDGFSTYLDEGMNLHFTDYGYKKRVNDTELRSKVNYWQEAQSVTLDKIRSWAERNKRTPFAFVTPGDYSAYFKELI